MQIIVLGAGLLGFHIKKRYPDLPVLSHDDCDITSPFDIDAVIRHYKPDVVINAAGITPHSPVYSDVFNLFKINSQAPRLLRDACDETNCQLIQISTDCVFSGQKGNYCEIDIPNSTTLYGLSKYLGEITDFPHLTIRTSFIGLPDPYMRGLLGWAVQQDRIVGYDQVLWNGLTAYELAQVLIEKIVPRRFSNTLHVYGQDKLSKYQVLLLAKEVYGWEYTIEPESILDDDPKHVYDLSLISELPEMCIQKPLKQMLEEMRDEWKN